MTHDERRLLLLLARIVEEEQHDSATIRKLIRRVHIGVAAEEKKRAIRIKREADLDARLAKAEIH